MLVGIIKEEKYNDNYYIYLNSKGNYNELSIIHVNNDIIEPLPRAKAKILLKTLLSSKLTFSEKLGDYEIYLDEANNKRYFKNGNENYFLFFKKNGVEAVKCITKKSKSNINSKSYKIITGGLTFTLVCSMAGLAVLAIKDAKYKEEAKYALINEEPITVEEMVDLVCESPYLDTDERELLCNDIFFAFVLDNSHGKPRTFHIKNALNNINIKSFKTEEFEGALGYYDLTNINTIRVLDVAYKNKNQYYDVVAHEYIHLMQDQNDYYYIMEASAEMMEYEFFDQPCDGYDDIVKRTKVLMEIVGPQPIIDCNFSGNTKTFEDSIGKYLSGPEKQKMLKLLSTPATQLYKTKEFTNKVNNGIDELLAKMYKNKTGKDIKDDLMIQYIYNSNPVDRIYFNPNKMEYNENCVLPSKRENIDELEMNDVIDSNKVKYFQFSKKMTKADTKDKYYQSQITTDIKDVPIEPNKFMTIVFKDGTQGLTQFDIKKGGWKTIVHYRLINQEEPSIPEKFPEQAKKPYIYNDEEYVMTIK
jgi:hypothetical protein